MFFLPFIGPLLQLVFGGIIDIFKKREDTKVKLDTNDVEVIKARTAAIIATKDDPGIRLARDAAMWPPILYVGVYIWDRMMHIPHPDLVWGVKPLDLPWETYLPVMAVYAFLFGLAYKGK